VGSRRARHLEGEQQGLLIGHPGVDAQRDPSHSTTGWIVNSDSRPEEMSGEQRPSLSLYTRRRMFGRSTEGRLVVRENSIGF